MIYLTPVRSVGDQNGVYQVVVRISSRPFDHFAKKRTFNRVAWNKFISKGGIMVHDCGSKCYRRASSADLH